jgi:uncharacterized membrane protein
MRDFLSLLVTLLAIIICGLLLTAAIIAGINFGLSEWIPQVPKITCAQAFWVSVLATTLVFMVSCESTGGIKNEL